jgi:hypothetical protein
MRLLPLGQYLLPGEDSLPSSLAKGWCTAGGPPCADDSPRLREARTQRRSGRLHKLERAEPAVSFGAHHLKLEWHKDASL